MFAAKQNHMYFSNMCGKIIKPMLIARHFKE